MRVDVEAEAGEILRKAPDLVRQLLERDGLDAEHAAFAAEALAGALASEGAACGHDHHDDLVKARRRRRAPADAASRDLAEEMPHPEMRAMYRRAQKLSRARMANVRARVRAALKGMSR